jgi:hypothetical protein
MAPLDSCGMMSQPGGIVKTSALAAALLLFAAQHAKADLPTVLGFEPPSLNVFMGQIFTVDLAASNAIGLTSWQLDLSFDETLLIALSVTEGAFLGTAGTTAFSPGTIDNGSGTITGVSGALQNPNSGVSNHGVLATIQFQAIATGVSALTIGNLATYEIGPVFLTETQSEPGSITVQAVPEPATVGLAAAGLLLAVAARLRRRAAA